MVGALRSVCCIIRTHSSIKASLESGVSRCTENKEIGDGSRIPIVIEPDGQNIAILLVLQRLQRDRTLSTSMEVVPEELYIPDQFTNLAADLKVNAP
jgi:hypothetical protein